MSKKYVKPHVKRAFQTVLEVYAFNQAQQKAAEKNFESAVRLYEELSGMKFNLNDQLVDESEREDYQAPELIEEQNATAGNLTDKTYNTSVEVTNTGSEPGPKFYSYDMSLTDKIVYVLQEHGKLSRVRIVEELRKHEPEMDEKKINATFYSMVQRNIITSPVGYNGEVTINPNRPEKKKKGRK